jgi:hypothetical protein
VPRAKRTSGSANTTPTRRRSRTARFQLRKHQELDHVRVEQAWSFGQPPQEADAPVKVGEAAYIAATIQNKRYHGILVESQALQAASVLHLQDQAQGLELNRRMQALQQQQSSPPDVSPPSDEIKIDALLDDTKVEAILSSDTTDPSSRKRPRNDDSNEAKDAGSLSTIEPETVPDRPIQKFIYETAGKLRRLVATFGNIAAAADGTDDGALPASIREACQSGGAFVGRYYYQYEVRGTAWLKCTFLLLRDNASLSCLLTLSSLRLWTCTDAPTHTIRDGHGDASVTDCWPEYDARSG